MVKVFVGGEIVVGRMVVLVGWGICWRRDGGWLYGVFGGGRGEMVVVGWRDGGWGSLDGEPLGGEPVACVLEWKKLRRLDDADAAS